MPKPSSCFICQSCGSVHTKWAGRCDSCGEWNTLFEETTTQHTRPKSKNKRNIDFVSLNGESIDVPRLKSGISELDRVTGGGLVPGSAILVGGDPGIGKSKQLEKRPTLALKQHTYQEKKAWIKLEGELNV